MFLLILGFFILLLILYILWLIETSKLSSCIPSPIAIPWLGTIPFLKRNPCQLFLQFQRFSKEYKNLYVLWLCNHPVIVTGRTPFVEYVLGNQDLLNKSSFYCFVHDWLGTGLLTSNRAKWEMRRKAITPSFHFSILKDFFQVFEEHSLVFVDRLRNAAQQNKPVDIQKLASLVTLDIICETAMGVKIEAQLKSHSSYVEAVINISEKIEQRIISPWLWPNFIYQFTSEGKSYYNSLNYLHSFTNSVINKQMEKHSNNERLVKGEKRKTAFLDKLLYLYDVGEIDCEGLREEVNTFIFEGHDTTSSAVSWTLYLLGRHKTVQRKLQSEIHNVCQAEKSSDLYTKINGLKYLDCVIKESLRMQPPATIFSRHVEKTTVINDILVPSGASILIDVLAVHYNPEFWTDPETFIPERFEEDSILKRHPYSFIPFSAGPRNCVGRKFAMLELKVLLYYIMSSFDVESIQTEEELQPSMELIHKSRNGLLLKFHVKE